MSVEGDQDLNVFFNTDEFGVPAIYNVSTTIDGIFEDSYVDVQFGEKIESSSPEFTTKTSNVPLVKHGDTLLVNGTNYRIVNPQPDGTGVIILKLEKV